MRWQEGAHVLLDRRSFLLALAGTRLLRGQEPERYLCPMDPQVRSAQPGKCPRCGMALVAGIPPLEEFSVECRTQPAVLKPGMPGLLRLQIRRKKTGEIVRDFRMMHERLFHLFLISEDLQYFAHIHPEAQADGTFLLPVTLPHAGWYRLLADVYPAISVPQLLAESITIPGRAPTPVPVSPDLAVKHTENMQVSLSTEPAQPLAGQKTLLFFDCDPVSGLEPYLGAWGHLLAASSDLIDMMHEHPFLADGGPRIQFNLIFPRPGLHRVWVQFQRQGVVNTAAFTVRVRALGEAS